jgi:nicotinate-nucleotide pyrophosphorylase (carboxylating)
MSNSLSQLLIRPYVEAALREDIRSGDVTTRALIPAEATARATMRFREAGVLCGLDVARLAFESLEWPVTFEEMLTGEDECDGAMEDPAEPRPVFADGKRVNRGQSVLKVWGNARDILTAERVALNFMQRLSGIATITQQFVTAVEGTQARIADTRKTTPGLRLLEKYAVRCGGGSNHRFALDDMILIKDNHIALCGGIGEAVRRARENIGHSVKVEVECDTLEQVEEAVTARADIILLDNMPPDVLRQAVEIIGGKALSEASGGVNLDTVRAIAESGVDIISIGALTHSARALDIGLDIEI